MFRKLYWVTEHVYSNGESKVLGVYTSIPDLIRHGLQPAPRGGHLRLTLTKLDSGNEPLGCWVQPNFTGLADKLEEFIKTDEFSKDHCSALCQALESKIVHANAA
jgi:hypothetical protein